MPNILFIDINAILSYLLIPRFMSFILLGGAVLENLFSVKIIEASFSEEKENFKNWRKAKGREREARKEERKEALGGEGQGEKYWGTKRNEGKHGVWGRQKGMGGIKKGRSLEEE